MRSLIVGFMIFSAAPALAADEKGIVHVRGLGNDTCGQVLAAVEKKNTPLESGYVQWIWGFMAGRNYYRDGNSDIPEYDATRFFMRKHCQTNPLNTVLNVATALIDEVRGGPSKASGFFEAFKPGFRTPNTDDSKRR